MVVYLSPTSKPDDYSGQVSGEDWSDPVRTEAPRAFVTSPSTSETNDGTNATSAESWMLRIPRGEVSPRPNDRIESDGQVFAQVGVVIRQRNPFTGWAPYARVRLTWVG